MCACSPEGQTYPALDQKKHGQQVEGGDSTLLLHSGDTPQGVLCPAPESSAQLMDKDLLEQDQRKAIKMIRGMEHLSCEERLGEFGVVQHGEEKVSGRPYCRLSVLKGSL